MELVKWPDIERTANLLYLFMSTLSADAIEELIRKI